MPSNPSTAYPTLGAVFTLARAIVNDVAGNWASDAVLLPYANYAYRLVGAELGNVQAASYIKDDVLMVLPAMPAADPSKHTSLTNGGYNNGTQNYSSYAGGVVQLPTDLLTPEKLWERTSGSTEDFLEMQDVSDSGGLPSETQGTRLRLWEWRSDGIYFLGGTQDNQIRIRYEAAFLDMTDAGSPLLIRDGQNAVALKTAELAGVVRGGPAAQMVAPMYEVAIELLKNRATQREQHIGRRRMPYGRLGHRGILR